MKESFATFDCLQQHKLRKQERCYLIHSFSYHSFRLFFFSLWQHSYLSVASFCQDEAVNFCMCKHMRNSRIQTKNNNKQTTKTQERKKIRRKPQKIADCMSIRTFSCVEYEYNANNNDCDVDEKKQAHVTYGINVRRDGTK